MTESLRREKIKTNIGGAVTSGLTYLTKHLYDLAQDWEIKNAGLKAMYAFNQQVRLKLEYASIFLKYPRVSCSCGANTYEEITSKAAELDVQSFNKANEMLVDVLQKTGDQSVKRALEKIPPAISELKGLEQGGSWSNVVRIEGSMKGVAHGIDLIEKNYIMQLPQNNYWQFVYLAAVLALVAGVYTVYKVDQLRKSRSVKR